MNIINLEAVPLHRVANAISNDNNGQLPVKSGEIDPLIVVLIGNGQTHCQISCDKELMKDARNLMCQTKHS